MLGIAVAIACVVLARAATVGGLSPAEMTVLPNVLRGEIARLDLRALCQAVLTTSVVLLPALVLARNAWRPRIGGADVCVGGITAAIGARLALSGRFPTLIDWPAASGVVVAAQVVLAALGAVLIARVAVPAAVGRTGRFQQVLALVALAHFVVLPAMQHPLLRHAMPAHILLVLLVGMQARMPHDRVRKVLPGVAAAVLIAVSLAAARAERAMNDAVFHAASRLAASGVPIGEIHAGWSWFCRHHLHPGVVDPEGYVARYDRLRDGASWVVTPEAAPVGTHVVAVYHKRAGFRPMLVRVCRRMSPAQRGGVSRGRATTPARIRRPGV